MTIHHLYFALLLAQGLSLTLLSYKLHKTCDRLKDLENTFRFQNNLTNDRVALQSEAIRELKKKVS